MAVFIIKKQGNFTLKGMLDYLRDMERHHNKIAFYDCFGVNPVNPAEGMMMTKLLMNQTQGRQYRHLVLSISDWESQEKNIRKLCIASVAMASYIFTTEKCQVAWAVHTNTSHYHAHFVLNSVRYSDGTRVNFRFIDLLRYKLKASVCLSNVNLESVRYSEYERRYLEEHFA